MVKAEDLDLRRILSFRPKGGNIQFMGHRAIILDTMTLGLLRKELICDLGYFSARNIMTRTGYAQGWSTADNLSHEYPELLQDSDCGSTLHMLQGIVNASQCEMSVDPEFHLDVRWEDSFEAEQHILHMGVAHEAVCWTLTGYVSGYCSRMFEKEIYCIEKQCSGKGDAYCVAEARLRQSWGDEIEPYLPYFEAKALRTELQQKTSKLALDDSRLTYQNFLDDADFAQTGMQVKSSLMRKVLNMAKRIAQVDSPVIVTGESGVGKERVACFIHEQSNRASNPWLAINCSAVTESLLESEFFGHVKGAFTGADKDRIGIFEAAQHGTLFLDEVAELPMSMQTKLLRTLQEKEIRRVGESISRPIDVRIIAATNKNLEHEVAQKRFREDLYYRLNVFEVDIPPLREREDDIFSLAKSFLEKANTRLNKGVIGFLPQAIDHMMLYAWPGNVRQLENAIEHATVMCQGTRIALEDFPLPIRSQIDRQAQVHPRNKALKEIEKEHILQTLIALKGDKTKAAKQLGISLSSLYQKLKKYETQGNEVSI